MIELRVPQALKPGDVVLVWWPDWHERRAVLMNKQHFNPRQSNQAKKTPETEVWRLTVQWRDGDDAMVETAIYRGDSELIPVIVKAEINDSLGDILLRRNISTSKPPRRTKGRKKDGQVASQPQG